MASPFPGMDPYIEGQAWGDFHSEFIPAVRSCLLPLLRPRYVARIEERVYLEYQVPEPLRYIGPDVAIAADTTAPQRRSGGTAVLARPVPVALPMPERIQEVFLEIRLRETWEVITVIEVLSPGNKDLGADGRKEYETKRNAVLRSGAHLVELDLLRGGARLPMAEPLPPGDYYAIVSRAAERPMAQVWPIFLREPLPTISIPLAEGDPPVDLDLQAAFTAAYERAGYDYSLDYRRAVVPRLSPEDAAWAQGVVAGRPA